MFQNFIHTLTVVAAMLSATCLISCKEKKSRFETFEVPATMVHSIEARSGINVVYEQKEGEPKVSVNCDTLITPLLSVNVIDGKLIATYKDENHIPRGNVTVNVVAPAVATYKAEMGAEIKAKEGVEITGNVEIEANTAGYVRFGAGLKCQKARIVAQNTGKVTRKKMEIDATEVKATTAAYVILEGNTQMLQYNRGTTADIVHKKLTTNRIDSLRTTEPYNYPPPKKQKQKPQPSKPQPATKDSVPQKPAA